MAGRGQKPKGAPLPGGTGGSRLRSRSQDFPNGPATAVKTNTAATLYPAASAMASVYPRTASPRDTGGEQRHREQPAGYRHGEPHTGQDALDGYLSLQPVGADAGCRPGGLDKVPSGPWAAAATQADPAEFVQRAAVCRVQRQRPLLVRAGGLPLSLARLSCSIRWRWPPRPEANARGNACSEQP
jgi:hypothetical protein